MAGAAGEEGRVAHLATADGLVTVEVDGPERGAELGRSLAGTAIVSVAARGSELVVAAAGTGVYRRTGDAWVALGLDGVHVWTVALAPDGAVYAGVEPAALWRVGGSPGPGELTGLSLVEGYEKWHSPWGPADLPGVVADESRLVVGVEVGGVAVSHDRGATWQARSTGLYEDVHHVVANGDVLYATTGMGCYRSLDEGRSWRWESDGIDRGYTQGLACANDAVLVAASSGPPPMWEAGGPEAAIFRADASDDPLLWTVVAEGFAGNVDRQALDAAGDLVVAGTSAGEVLVSHDAGRTFDVVTTGLPAISAVAIG